MTNTIIQSMVPRFMEKVKKDSQTGCWEWTGSRINGGYGQISSPGPKGSSPLRAHRFSYMAFHGPIPAGVWVLHMCDNPRCVNPEHLYLGSAKDNSRDMLERGRHNTNPNKRESHHNSKLTEEAVRDIRNTTGSHAEAAKKYGVTRQLVSGIRKGRGWEGIT